VKGVGEPCAGEPHARFDGRGLETERYGVTAPAPDPTNLADEGHDFHPQLERIVTLWRAAAEEGVPEFKIVLELARFGALFAEMTGNDTLAMAADIGRDVMAQPDDDKDG
jgi:hypothetical protein